MTWRDTFRTAAEAVRTHRLRSALTMLGILIGITAVVLTVGLGSGARAEVQDQINELGTNVLVVSPGSSTDSSGVRGGFGSASTLTVAGRRGPRLDADVAPDVEAVAAAADHVGVARPPATTNWTTTLTGTTPSWQDVRVARRRRSGRFLTDEDEDEAAAVVVLGPDTATELFAGARPGRPDGHATTAPTLEVIGVLEALSARRRTPRNNDLAIVPLSHLRAAPRRRRRPRLGQLDLREGHLGRHAVGRLPGDRRHSCSTSTASPSRDDADFSIATQESILTAATLGRRDADRDARRHRRHLAARRRHRRDEHHAGLGHRADPRDRPAQGARRPAPADPPPVPRRGVASSGSPAGCSASRSASSAPSSCPRLTDTRVILSLPASLAAIVMAIGIGVALRRVPRVTAPPASPPSTP